jgi:hypothetical protein
MQTITLFYNDKPDRVVQIEASLRVVHSCLERMINMGQIVGWIIS